MANDFEHSCDIVDYIAQSNKLDWTSFIIHKPLYSAKELLRLAIEHDINGQRFNELNKFECCMLFCKKGSLKAGPMLRLRKFIMEFNFTDVESGLICVIPISDDDTQ